MEVLYIAHAANKFTALFRQVNAFLFPNPHQHHPGVVAEAHLKSI